MKQLLLNFNSRKKLFKGIGSEINNILVLLPNSLMSLYQKGKTADTM